ncbi:MAG: hypothetical protein H8E42_00130 [Nitrospinae bacterium]|nr:hypothetical protein [Nitrospinota bacterium]
MIIELGQSVSVVIDSRSVIVTAETGEQNRPAPTAPTDEPENGDDIDKPVPDDDEDDTVVDPDVEQLPTRFQGSVILSSDRPSRDMHQIVEAVIEQLTTIPGASVELKLEIDADVKSGIDKGKARTILENANTLGFIDKELN